MSKKMQFKRLPAFLIRNYKSFSSQKFSQQVSNEVKDAIDNSEPVVALESTIITHGMPYPDNLKTALKVENIIRKNGAIPATIGILKGQIKIGLTEQEIASLAENNDHKKALKVSRRDLPYVISQKMNGGTTVAATMILARMANIPVFVTGGIGGVHQGAEISFDVSADLTELGRTPITVVCAGVKSILDIEKTLEYLETEGVTVATYGDNTEFPAFFTPKSGFQSPYCVKNALEAAKMITARDHFNLSNAILIAVPIPGDSEGNVEIQSAIDSAVKEARNKRISGKNATPFILKRVSEYSKGKALELNERLVENNAEVGALIAVELSKMKRERLYVMPGPAQDQHKQVIVIGGTNIDYNININEKVTFSGQSLNGNIRRSYGGVGRNIAECISKLSPDKKPLFISVVGNDEVGKEIKHNNEDIDVTGMTVLSGENTATHCCVIGETGEYLFGIADMDIHQRITKSIVSKFERELENSPLVVVDGNMPNETMTYVFDKCNELNVPVWFEPTDPRLAAKPFQTNLWKKITYTSPNYQELVTMVSCIHSGQSNFSHSEAIVEDTYEMCRDLSQYIPVILATLGDKGIILSYRSSFASGIHHRPETNYEDSVVIKHFPAMTMPQDSQKNMSGAGDCLAGTVIAGLLKGYDINLVVKAGIVAASRSISSNLIVPPTINCDVFSEAKKL